jgi:hypothetical protein
LETIPAPDLARMIERRSREAAPSVEPPPFPPSGHRLATALVVAGTLIACVLAGLLLWRALPQHGPTASPPPTPESPSPSPAELAVTPCSEIIPDCTAKRLPDLTLTDGATDGALGPVDGMDTSGLISFDDALFRGGYEGSGMTHPKTVRVVLGSADADRLRWGHGTNLYYAIEWRGGCILGPGGPPRPTPAPPRCFTGTSGTVIDAHTGEFIVGGSSGSDPDGSGAPSVTADHP